MPCEIIRVENDLISARVSGVMRMVEHLALQKAAVQVLARVSRIRFLAVLEDFQGWEKGVDWSDIGFMIGYGKDIVRMAIVGDAAWKDQCFAFLGKGLRPTEIEFFPPDHLEEAELWVRQQPGPAPG